MKKNYELQGMSCRNCVDSIRDILLQLPNVSKADVQLNPQKAILTLIKPVSVAELQSQLNRVGHYIIKKVV